MEPDGFDVITSLESLTLGDDDDSPMMLNLGQSLAMGQILMLNEDGTAEENAPQYDHMNRSWVFSQSGVFEANGLKVSESGIEAAPEKIQEKQPILTALVTHPNELEFQGTLGSGISSVVQKAIHKPTGTALAVKVFNFSERDKRRQLVEEISVLLQFQQFAHPNVVQFHGCFIDREKARLLLCLELMPGGSLDSLIEKKGPLPEEEIRQIARDVTCALAFLQKHKIVHRDIKPANILIDEDGTAKLADFGVTRQMDGSGEMATTQTGTMIYMSPERLNGEPYSFQSDMWSLGLVLMTAALGRFPLEHVIKDGPMAIIHAICEEDIPQLPEDKFSVTFRSFVQSCLFKDHKKRWDAQMLLKSHPFVK